VNYDENEKQVIDVKIYGEVNLVKMKRQIRKAFPNATIRNLMIQALYLSSNLLGNTKNLHTSRSLPYFSPKKLNVSPRLK
jgi:hypothetical protein